MARTLKRVRVVEVLTVDDTRTLDGETAQKYTADSDRTETKLYGRQVNEFIYLRKHRQTGTWFLSDGTLFCWQQQGIK